MERVRELVRALAAAPADVVIYGETGTGKDLVARCLHDHSERRRGNFVPVNCGGLPETLVDSELFGHEAGAFTGAIRRRIGKFEHANGGTLFLDEIESMPLAVQVKFLRALQERSIERIGSNTAVPIDCRVIAASKDDLKCPQRAEAVPRRSLLPPRCRLHRAAAAARAPRGHPAAVRALHAAGGTPLRPPGADCGRPHLVDADGAFVARQRARTAQRGRSLRARPARRRLSGSTMAPRSLPEQLEHIERALISESLRSQHGDVPAAAKALGVPKQTLYDKLRRLHIDATEFRGGTGLRIERRPARTSPASQRRLHRTSPYLPALSRRVYFEQSTPGVSGVSHQWYLVGHGVELKYEEEGTLREATGRSHQWRGARSALRGQLRSGGPY